MNIRQNQCKHVGSPKRAGHICQPPSPCSKRSLKEAVVYRDWGVRTGEGGQQPRHLQRWGKSNARAVPVCAYWYWQRSKGWPCFCSWTLLWGNRGVLAAFLLIKPLFFYKKIVSISLFWSPQGSAVLLLIQLCQMWTLPAGHTYPIWTLSTQFLSLVCLASCSKALILHHNLVLGNP